MLSNLNFIRKRKGNKANESGRGHQQSSSVSSSVGSNVVLDIKEDPSSLSAAQSSPLVVQLNIADSDGPWFPQDLFRSRSGSPEEKVTRNDLTRPSTAPGHSRNNSTSIAARKKSIPAPILIPGAGLLMPHVQIGNSSVRAEAPLPPLPQPNADAIALNPPSPSTSENLSSVSGTTLARALIASSFTLSSTEHRSSHRRSGVARQDSATLPRGDVLFLSSSSPIPPVPPMHEKVIKQVYQSTINSGASTESEYPVSTPSPVVATSTKVLPSAAPNKALKRKVNPSSVCPRIVRDNVFDVPKTAVEASLPIHSRVQQVSLSLEGHTLDEFDFVPLEPLVATTTPDSDSSASYVALVPKRNGTVRGQWARRIGGPCLVRNRSKDDSYPMSSATMSEHDYGELHNYDLTVSPGSCSSSHLPSSVSGGYQTFPETPVVFSPLESPGYTFLARSDSQLRKPRSSPKYPRPGIGKSYTSLRVARADNKDRAGTALALRRSRSYSQPAKTSLSPPQENDEVDKPEEVIQSSGTGPGDSRSSLEPQRSDRHHPLAQISSSSTSLPDDELFRVLAQQSSSLSLLSILKAETNALSDAPVLNSSVELLASIPLPGSADVSPSISSASTGSVMVPSPFSSPLQSSLPSSTTAVSQSNSSKSPLSAPSSSLGESPFLPSPLLSASFPESHSRSASPAQIIRGISDELGSRPSSFLPPPPYHVAVSERTPHHPESTTPPFVSRGSPIDPGYERNRLASDSSVASGTTRTRMRARPPLPIGPRRPSAPAQIPGAFVPGVHDRNGFKPSADCSGSPTSAWCKLQSAASKHPPKFQRPPPKWRGLTLEAAHWTFTSAQLQEIVSQAIRQSSEGSSLRLLRPETLDGEIADEVHRLELQHTDVKAQYKGLVRKRWMLMGALTGHIEGTGMSDALTASRTMEELTEVMSALDHLAEKMHEIALQLAQLKSLREVHNASALAMVVRKINGLFVRQMAEKERLMEKVGVLQTEREEAWKHAETIAKDYDTLNDSVAFAGGRADVGVETESQPSVSSKRSTRISAVRKSSVRLSQSGLRNKPRTHRSSSGAPRPTSLTLDDVPPIPRLPVNMTSPLAVTAIDSALSLASMYSSNATSEAWELAQAQREVYEMLGLSVPPSQASSRRRTLSNPDDPKSPARSSRPASESFDVRIRSRGDRDRATKSVTFEDRPSVSFPFTVSQYQHIVGPLR